MCLSNYSPIILRYLSLRLLFFLVSLPVLSHFLFVFCECECECEVTGVRWVYTLMYTIYFIFICSSQDITTSESLPDNPPAHHSLARSTLSLLTSRSGELLVLSKYGYRSHPPSLALPLPLLPFISKYTVSGIIY